LEAYHDRRAHTGDADGSGGQDEPGQKAPAAGSLPSQIVGHVLERGLGAAVRPLAQKVGQGGGVVCGRPVGEARLA
jgi:hypothetical protein